MTQSGSAELYDRSVETRGVDDNMFYALAEIQHLLCWVTRGTQEKEEEERKSAK